MFTCACKSGEKREQWNLCKYSYTIFIKFSCGFFAMTCINRSWEMGKKERSLRRIVNLNWILRPLCARSKGFHEKRLLSGAFFGKTFIQFQSLFDQWTEMSRNCCCKHCSLVRLLLDFGAPLWPKHNYSQKKSSFEIFHWGSRSWQAKVNLPSNFHHPVHVKSTCKYWGGCPLHPLQLFSATLM